MLPQDMWRLRMSLRKHPLVTEQLHRWWQLVAATYIPESDQSEEAAMREGLGLRMSEYLDLQVKLYKVLINPFDPRDAKECARADWKSDCGGGAKLDRDHLMDCVFEVADVCACLLQNLALPHPALQHVRARRQALHLGQWRCTRVIPVPPAFSLPPLPSLPPPLSPPLTGTRGLSPLDYQAFLLSLFGAVSGGPPPGRVRDLDQCHFTEVAEEAEDIAEEAKAEERALRAAERRAQGLLGEEGDEGGAAGGGVVSGQWSVGGGATAALAKARAQKRRAAQQREEEEKRLKEEAKRRARVEVRKTGLDPSDL